MRHYHSSCRNFFKIIKDDLVGKVVSISSDRVDLSESWSSDRGWCSIGSDCRACGIGGNCWSSSDRDLRGRGVSSNCWSSDVVMDWGLHSHWGLHSDLLDDLSDADLWLDLSDLWSNFSVSSDWGQDSLFGDQGLKVSSLGGANRDGGLSISNSSWGESLSSVGHSGRRWDGSTGFNDFGISSDNWSWSSDSYWSGRGNGNRGSSNRDGWKSWSMKSWDSWLNDGGRISGHDWLGLVVDGLLNWH